MTIFWMSCSCKVQTRLKLVLLMLTYELFCAPADEGCQDCGKGERWGSR